MFQVTQHPTAGFNVVGIATQLMLVEAVPTVEMANQFTHVLNTVARQIEHEWQHVVADVMAPLVENWETHVGPQDARGRGSMTTVAIDDHLAQLVTWLRLWLADAESQLNDPVSRQLSDQSIYRMGVKGQPNVTYGDVRKMLAFLDQAGDEPDQSMLIGATYRHADGGMYELMAINVDHKGEDGEWRPGVLYSPTLTGGTGDQRLKTTTVARWRERFQFAG